MYLLNIKIKMFKLREKKGKDPAKGKPIKLGHVAFVNDVTHLGIGVSNGIMSEKKN